MQASHPVIGSSFHKLPMHWLANNANLQSTAAHITIDSSAWYSGMQVLLHGNGLSVSHQNE